MGFVGTEWMGGCVTWAVWAGWVFDVFRRRLLLGRMWRRLYLYNENVEGTLLKLSLALSSQ